MEGIGKYAQNYGNQNLGMTVIVTNQARAYHTLGHNNIYVAINLSLQLTDNAACKLYYIL
jgi:hypothetical protein